MPLVCVTFSRSAPKRAATPSFRGPLQDVDGVGGDVNLDLAEPFEKPRLEGGKELPVLRSVLDVYHDADEFVLVPLSFMDPDTQDRIGMERNGAELTNEVKARLVELLRRHRLAVV